MGILAPGSAHARPSAHPPIHTIGNFPARLSAEWYAKVCEISASANGGPSSRVYAHETLFLAPINVSGNFQARVSAKWPSSIPPSPSKNLCFRGRGVANFSKKYFDKFSSQIRQF